MKLRTILIFMCTLFITGCGNKTDMADLSDIGETIGNEMKSHMMENGGFTDADFTGDTLPSYTIARLNDQNFNLPIEYDKKYMEDAIAFTHNEDNSDMIVVLRAKTDNDVAQLENYVKSLRDEQYKKWETGAADQFEKVQQSITKTFGRYVVYATHDAPQRIVDAVEKALSKKA